jgi:hypothetical protein
VEDFILIKPNGNTFFGKFLGGKTKGFIYKFSKIKGMYHKLSDIKTKSKIGKNVRIYITRRKIRYSTEKK